MSKVVSLQEAVDLIKTGDLIASSGFLLSGVAEEVFVELERRFLEKGEPKDLKGLHSAGQGNWAGAGWDRLAHEGLLTWLAGGHFGSCEKMGDLINANKIVAYNIPQGVVSHMYKSIAKGEKGLVSKIGLGTYVDPDLEGGRLNSVTTEDIISKVKNPEGEDRLYYKNPVINIGLIRGTVADENGSISLEEEITKIDMLDVAMAAKACGGKVICQVKYISDTPLTADRIDIPGTFVDAVYLCEDIEANHRQTFGVFYDGANCGKYNVKLSSGNKKAPLDNRKVIARRCAMELVPNAVVNLGVGMPEMVADVAKEEGVSDQLILTTENGNVGGVPLGGLSFGAGLNTWGNVPMSDQFDFYDGGGLDVTFLGLAQADKEGNLNVSKFGTKVTGCGGFMNIAQNTEKVVFCGTFTAAGLKEEIGNGKLTILNEGKVKKFIDKVEQITFSGKYATDMGQDILYVTERCVFKLTDGQLELIEIAPGVDLQKDILDLMDFKPLISDDLKTMDEAIFKDEPIGLEKIIMSK